jgi:dolichol-phosphate mannosyltransferase
MTVNGHRISICIPAKDEAATIEEVIDRSRPHGDEIFVVDGHSKDQTRELAEAMGVPVYLDAGLGKGCAVREAVARATGDILVTIDADLSFDPGDIPRLVAPVANGDAEYGSGSRMRGGSDELHGDLDKFIRMVGQDIITLGVNYRFDVRLTDSQSGFRAFDLAAARSITLVENITTTEQEMIIKFLRKGYRIVEVPTHEYASRRDRSHISLRRHAARYVYSWLRYLFF